MPQIVYSVSAELLRDNLGILETEIFLTEIGRNTRDYTKWRERLWEDLSPEDLLARTAETTKMYAPPEGVEIVRI